MGEMQVVVFSLNGQLFGAEASQVFQIVKYQKAAKIPEMPMFMEGVLNYRGAVLPVINLNKRFDLGEVTADKKTKIIISRIDGRLAGFIVNDVTEIKSFTDDELEPVPVIGSNRMAAFIKRVGKRGDKLITIIDLDKVLEDSEIEKLSVEVS